MRFGYTILYVRDVAASVALYERAFGQSPRFVHESGDYAELETGDTVLAFASHELAESNLGGAFQRGSGGAGATPFEVCFVTDDVAGAYDRALRGGADPVTPPHTTPWGQDVAYVRDVDGNLIELASPAG
jgi:lactoylglutathione lyase